MTDTSTEWTDDPSEASAAADLIPKEPDTHCNARTRSGSYCGHEAGWGVPDKSTGRCKMHGALGGGPKGEKNGRFKNGLYSEYMGEADKERAGRWVELAGGDRLSLDQFSLMFEKMLLYEFTRLERAMQLAPDPDLAHKWACETCGHGVSARTQQWCPSCETDLTTDGSVVPIAEWVDMHDRSVADRAESLADMIETYKNVTEGSDLNLHGHVEVDFETALRRAQELADAGSEGAETAATQLEYLRGEATSSDD